MKRALLTSLVLVLLSCSCAFAAGEEKSSLTLYSGRALVSQTHFLVLPQGKSFVEIPGVPASLVPGSVSLAAKSGSGLKLRSVTYLPAPSASGILHRYVGQTVQVVLPDEKDASARMIKSATVLAAGSQPLFRIDDKIYFGKYDAVILPDLPGGVRPTPSLRVDYENSGKTGRELELSYLANGFSWRAEYVLDLQGDKGTLAGWAVLQNDTAVDFSDARIRLVAGDVQGGGHPVMARNRMVKAEAMMMDAAPAAPEQAFDYHSYTLDSSVSLPARSTVQAALLVSDSFPVKRELVSRFSVYPGSMPGEMEQPVSSVLRFSNAKGEGPGVPIPGGVIRAYGKVADGGRLFLGEDQVEHTPVDGDVRLAVGNAFDVRVKRTQTVFAKTGKNAWVLGYEIVITNADDESRTVVIEDSMPGQWEVEESSAKYLRSSSGMLRFTINVPQNDRVKLTYKAAVRM